MEIGGLHFLDKIPVKSDYADRGVRVVPPGVARYGSFLSEGVVLMPGFVNIGAWVGPRTMVDTWATVGSCAQIGADVHLSGGVGIGGVLEPPQARPVIIEDGAFIGSRAVVVEGVVVGEGAVIAPNVVLSASIPVIDVTGSSRSSTAAMCHRAVVSGTRPKDSGRTSTCRARSSSAREASTDLKTSLNDVLRVRDRDMTTREVALFTTTSSVRAFYRSLAGRLRSRVAGRRTFASARKLSSRARPRWRTRRTKITSPRRPRRGLRDLAREPLLEPRDYRGAAPRTSATRTAPRRARSLISDCSAVP